MERNVAAKMTNDLVGKTVGGWLVRKYVNNGKSAVVFLAEKNGNNAALKVFDPELVQRYGRDTQRKRIERELSLIGKEHPHLIRVYDGGEDGQFFFIAMEYFEGKNLATVLQKLPTSEVRSLISQIASAAKFLEDSMFAHRDIKPENIGVTPDMKSAILLDLGVIRPLDLSSITDEGDQHYFVGTLQYSPPELLFREEEQSVEGWRAVTFYQLGGVLHDLLVRKPLFDRFKNPYARLVRAVEREIPRIDTPNLDPDLRLLAQNCLAKSPSQRLDTVKWDDFSSSQHKVPDPIDAARRRIAMHRAAAKQTSPGGSTSAEHLLDIQSFALRSSIHSGFVNTCKAENLPRYSIETILKWNPFLLRALFAPATKDGLRCHFAFYCQGTVLDATANLHEIRLWACASPTLVAIPTNPDPGEPSRLVKGTLIDQDIRLNVQQFLLLAYADVLDHEPGDSDPVQWLKVENNS